MSTVNGQKTLERGLKALFIKEFANAEVASDILPFVMETSSDGADEDYGWLGQSPSMNEWVDERRLKALNSFQYALKNKDYEATLSVDRNALEDDRLGAVQVRIADLAKKAKSSHPRKLFFEALVAGTAGLCYDGQPMFSVSHAEGGSGTQSNLLSGSGVTAAQLSTDIETAIAALKNYKDDIGEPYNEGEIQIGIVCPPALEAKFKAINTADYITQGVSNTLKGTIKTIVSSGRLTDANDWYLADVTPGLKPFVRQIRQAPIFSALEGKSDNGFMRKKYLYGVDSREVFGYGLWQKMVKFTNA